VRFVTQALGGFHQVMRRHRQLDRVPAVLGLPAQVRHQLEVFAELDRQPLGRGVVLLALQRNDDVAQTGQVVAHLLVKRVALAGDNFQSGAGHGALLSVGHRRADEDQLRRHFIEPYEEGRPVTWGGRTLPAGDFGTITITETGSIQQVPRFEEYSVVTAGTDVTNDWIKGPPGKAATSATENSGAQRNPRRVMVVYGRNQAARNAIFTFLRTVGLEPIEWEEAVAQTGMGSPHNLDAVRSAMDIAQAVVVILTAEDRAGILPELADDGEDLSLRGQPRQNVTLEAGLAMGLNPQRTILVEIGTIRRASDFDGLNTVRLNNGAAARGALRDRLATRAAQ
jgi:predicted nucleotide-binding protein